MINKHVELRSMVPEDESFIYSAWLKSYRSSPVATYLDNDTYYDNHKKIIEKLLLKANVTILCSKEDSSQIYGFLCHEGNTAHYLYIKYPFRKMGLAKYLFNSVFSDATIVITHFNTTLKSRLDTMTYNPYLLFKETK
jgi:hypothetical protein